MNVVQAKRRGSRRLCQTSGFDPTPHLGISNSRVAARVRGRDSVKITVVREDRFGSLRHWISVESCLELLGVEHQYEAKRLSVVLSI
jgi:hypothetical protein